MHYTRCNCAALALLIAASTDPDTLRGQIQSADAPITTGVLLVAHGADADWNSRVDFLPADVRRSDRTDGPVAVSFLMDRPLRQLASRTRLIHSSAPERVASSSSRSLFRATVDTTSRSAISLAKRTRSTRTWG